MIELKLGTARVATQIIAHWICNNYAYMYMYNYRVRALFSDHKRAKDASAEFRAMLTSDLVSTVQSIYISPPESYTLSRKKKF